MKLIDEILDDFVRFIEFVTGIQIPTFKHCLLITWLCIFTPWLILNSIVYRLLNFDLLYDGQTDLASINDDINLYHKRYKKPVVIYYDILFFTGTLFHASILLALW